MPTYQTSIWTGEFGKEYTQRNQRDPDVKNQVYINNYGISRTALNEEFLCDLDRNTSILEVGTNTGDLLLILRKMGFTNLTGIEIQPEALATARRRVPGMKAVRAYAQALPFASNSFDLVYTSGVLIHIHPQDVLHVIREVHRCSKRLIWGLEYYNDSLIEVPYRNHESLLWKGDYARMYLEECPNLKTVKTKMLPRLDDGNKDQMFLLEKS